MLHVRPGDVGDMPTILGFIDEAAGWLALKGTNQWARPWPDEEQRDARVRRGLENGHTWIVEDEGTPVATISCRPDANPDLWHEAERDEPAVYVARLICSRSHGGQGIGDELVSWAGRWAAAQYGALWIRIDVWTTNTLLHGYYEKRGFSFVRFCDDVEYPSAALFQKAIAEISDADVPRLREVPALRQPERGTSALMARAAGRSGWRRTRKPTSERR